MKTLKLLSVFITVLTVIGAVLLLATVPIVTMVGVTVELHRHEDE
jgi:hypothetical protein